MNCFSRLLVAAMMGLLLSACASTQKLGDGTRKSVKAAYVSNEVKKTQEMYILAPGAAIGLMFGPVGGLATAAGNIGPTQAMQAFVDKHSISIEKIAREEIEAALKASGKLPIAPTPEAANATIKITVEQHGFSVPNLLSSNVVPVLYLKCEMLDASGKSVWMSSDRVLPSAFTVVDPVSFEAMKNDPQLIDKAWRQAARILAKNIATAL